MIDKQVFPLSKLTAAIENVINTHCNKFVWVKAEIVKLNYYKHTGHCYPELVEKKDGKIIAEIRGNIWKPQFDQINEKFRLVLNEDLGDNMTVVIRAAVTYHSVYGLALNILDIDPEYTLGELARQKLETIKKLKEENIFYANKDKHLPVLPKTIAIISVGTSMGYLDFMNVIENNPRGYKYHLMLFPAVLQGERAVSTIIAQLKKIKTYGVFDAVAIIRGGGGTIGFSCYDSYTLSREIARYPLPVLTGIGHSSNETVVELVSFKSFITPTKIAEFLLQEFNNFAFPLKEQTEKLNTQVSWKLEREKGVLKETTRLFSAISLRLLDKNEYRLEQISSQLINSTRNFMQAKNTKLQILGESIHNNSPQTILKRGYSITRANGKVILDPAILDEGDLVETELHKGRLTSRVENKKTKL